MQVSPSPEPMNSGQRDWQPTGPLVTSFAHHQARNIDSVKRWVWMVRLLFLAVGMRYEMASCKARAAKPRDEAINRPRGEHKPKAVSCGNQNQARPRAELHFPHGLVHQRNEVSKSWHLSETYETHLIYEQFHINLECCSPRPMSWLAGSKCLTILPMRESPDGLMAGRVGLEDKNISRLICMRWIICLLYSHSHISYNYILWFNTCVSESWDTSLNSQCVPEHRTLDRGTWRKLRAPGSDESCSFCIHGIYNESHRPRCRPSLHWDEEGYGLSMYCPRVWTWGSSAKHSRLQSPKAAGDMVQLVEGHQKHLQSKSKRSLSSKITWNPTWPPHRAQKPQLGRRQYLNRMLHQPVHTFAKCFLKLGVKYMIRWSDLGKGNDNNHACKKLGQAASLINVITLHSI